MRLVAIIFRETLNTIKRPGRVLQILDPKKLSLHLEFLRLSAEIGDSWSSDVTQKGLRKRSYTSYDAYISHQKNKLQCLDLSEYDSKYQRVLRERLQKLDVAWEEKNALCLAARIGTEVKSFMSLGCFAVGIDINPGKNSPYVLHGDIHSVQFPDHSTDIIFTNALDHIFDPEKVISEMDRLLKPNGLLIIEAVRGMEEGERPGFHESFYWSKIDDLVRIFENAGFRSFRRSPFSYPWDGEQICFAK